MPTTRKKVVKTVYKDEDSEGETGDFSDSGSDAKISDASSSDEEQIEETQSSADEFDSKPRKKPQKPAVKRRPKFAKQLIGKINKQTLDNVETEALPLFSVKDLTDSDKLLPSVLNLSESDSSDDEAPRAKKTQAPIPYPIQEQDESEEDKEEYADVWSTNIHDNSAEIAKKTFMELEKHKTTIEETKASIQNYVPRASVEVEKVSNVTDLLAMGEEAPKKSPTKKKARPRKGRDDSDSEVEDWEEVKDSKAIPQQGLQLVVELPNIVCRKSKKIDVEMMMKRKINRVKKEHQVFMHKVHVLCWLGHGNYVSPILNDQEIMAAILAMVPKGCYPEGRLNMKYVEQITEWYKDKLTLKQDKNENKFKPKAPSLKNILLEQIKKRTVTAKKYSVFIFVAMLRALGLQCRVMFNFVTIPLKPPSSELCSLSIKSKDDKDTEKVKAVKPKATSTKSKNKSNVKLPQVDGIDDSFLSSDSEWTNIMQVDGNDDILPKRTMRLTRAKKVVAIDPKDNQEDVSPPKRTKREAESSKDDTQTSVKTKKTETKNNDKIAANKGTDASISASSMNKVNLKTIKSPKMLSLKKINDNDPEPENISNNKSPAKAASPRKTRSNSKTTDTKEKKQVFTAKKSDKLLNQKVKSKEQSKDQVAPKIVITSTNQKSKYFDSSESTQDAKVRTTRKRGTTTIVNGTQKPNDKQNEPNSNRRSRSAPGEPLEKSKYFNTSGPDTKKPKLSVQKLKNLEKFEDAQRVSHKEISKPKPKPKNDVTGDLVNLIKGRIKGAREDAKKGMVKGKIKVESDEDSDYLPVEDLKRNSESDDDFKPTKISPRPAKLSPGSKPSTSKKQIDRRVISPDDELVNSNKVDVWCEVFIEELEQWVAVDVIKGKVHGTSNLYSQATHPVCYIIGWDNNNYLKDLTRRYVPQWNTVTRKQRAELAWWKIAVQPWLGPRNARDREEDEALDRMQLEAPLPKSIAEYKNHPLYALKRHLLKYEAIYPADAATLGFVRSEAVYGRDCVYTCRSRDTWLKEAKVVKLGETPYKVVKARPKWDKLSNKLITDKPLEVFGPWQVQDYEPPTAQNGVVPRNAYGNVELFKDCMLPFGTVHIKLPGLNKVARKLNIDCAPAMTGFDFNGGWSHPVYDGFVVCKEFEEIITDAWVKDQEEQERREREKIELRVYGNWKRLIKGLLIRERLKHKYGFEEPTTTQPKKKGPRFNVKKK